MPKKKPEMPNIRERNYSTGRRIYFLDYWDPWKSKRMRISIGSRKADAIQQAAKVFKQMMERWHGTDITKVQDISLQDLIESYIRNKTGRVSDSTVSRYMIHMRHLSEFMEEHFPAILMISQIRKDYLIEHMDHLRKNGQEPRTLNAQIQQIKELFAFAVKEGYLANNPSKLIQRYKETGNKGRIKYWSKEELINILSETRDPWRDAFEFLYYTGLRKGELIFLTWDDVNLDANEPYISIQAKDGWDPKSRARNVSLNDHAIEIISRQSNSSRHNYVFKGHRGGQIHRDRIYHEVKRVLHELGLEGHVHKFRHTFASHLVMAGVGIETVSKLLGHSSIEMTMKYAHLAPDHLHTAVNKLNID